MGSPASIRKLLITFGIGTESEVNQFDLLSGRINKDVIKLDVTMYDIMAVNVIQSRYYLL